MFRVGWAGVRKLLDEPSLGAIGITSGRHGDMMIKTQVYRREQSKTAVTVNWLWNTGRARFDRLKR